MADKLEEDIDRYINLWTDIASGGISEPLPEIDKDTYLNELSQELRSSFNDDSSSNIKKQLETYHKVTKQAHYLRGILSVTTNYLLNLRGLKNVLK